MNATLLNIAYFLVGVITGACAAGIIFCGTIRP